MLTKTSPNSSPTTSSTATASGQTVSRVPKARNRSDAKYTGREIIEKKVAIMKEYLRSEYSADLDKIRAEAQKRLPLVASMDFTKYPNGY